MTKEEEKKDYFPQKLVWTQTCLIERTGGSYKRSGESPLFEFDTNQYIYQDWNQHRFIEYQQYEFKAYVDPQRILKCSGVLKLDSQTKPHNHLLKIESEEGEPYLGILFHYNPFMKQGGRIQYIYTSKEELDKNISRWDEFDFMRGTLHYGDPNKADTELLFRVMCNEIVKLRAKVTHLENAYISPQTQNDSNTSIN